MFVLSPSVLFGLQLLGLLPVTVNHLPLRGDIASFSCARVTYCIFLMIFYCLAFGFWFLKSADQLLNISQTTWKIASICNAFSAVIAVVASYYVAVIRVKRKILLVEKMREVDFLLKYRLDPPKTRPITSLIIIIFLTLTTIETIYLLFSELNRSTFDFYTFCQFNYFKIVIFFALLEMMEVVLSIKERFQLVNERVLEVAMRHHLNQPLWTVALPFVETFTIAPEMDMTIPGLSDVHWRLCRIVFEFNAIYGINVVVVMLFIFAHLVYNPYLAFILINVGISWYAISFIVTWILLHIVELYMLALPCSMVAEEAKKTVTIVTKLMGNKLVKPVFNELETFANQLFHREVEFTACGLFTIDTCITISVASAVTTYLAIIMQFQTSSAANVDTTRANVTTSNIRQHYKG